MENIVQSIKDCSSCPYSVYWEFSGMHCENPLTDAMPADDRIIDDYIDSNIIPLWCGLKQYDTLITLGKPIANG